MRCLSCNAELSDDESVRKFNDHEEIKNPEEKYISLCNSCLQESDLSYYIDTSEITVELPEIDEDEEIYLT